MTVPRGFGNEDQSKRYEGKKCIFGKVCEPAYGCRCKIHSSWNNNWPLYLMVIILTAIVLIVALYFVLDGINHDNLYPIINGLNCNQVREYIADKSDHFLYAEHRYKWLCLDDKSIVFEGGS